MSDNKRNIIIRIHSDDISDSEAMYYVHSVINGGKVSETYKGKQYCFHTQFADGVHVSCVKRSKSDVFHVYRKSEGADRHTSNPRNKMTIHCAFDVEKKCIECSPKCLEQDVSDTNESIAEPKSCETCMHGELTNIYNCKLKHYTLANQTDCNEWQPKVPVQEFERFCDDCRFTLTSHYYEPCASCKDETGQMKNWRPKEKPTVAVSECRECRQLNTKIEMLIDQYDIDIEQLKKTQCTGCCLDCYERRNEKIRNQRRELAILNERVVYYKAEIIALREAIDEHCMTTPCRICKHYQIDIDFCRDCNPSNNKFMDKFRNGSDSE